MKCREVMTRDPVCCAPDDSASRIAKIMKTQDVGSVPICESKRLLGIITDRDLALQIVAEGRDAASVKARDIMTKQPVSCRPDDDLETALSAMQRQQVRRIPVVDNNGQLVGIIAQADIATRTKQPEKTAEVVEEVSRPSTMRAG